MPFLEAAKELRPLWKILVNSDNLKLGVAWQATTFFAPSEMERNSHSSHSEWMTFRFLKKPAHYALSIQQTSVHGLRNALGS